MTGHFARYPRGVSELSHRHGSRVHSHAYAAPHRHVVLPWRSRPVEPPHDHSHHEPDPPHEPDHGHSHGDEAASVILKLAPDTFHRAGMFDTRLSSRCE
jgi:hypothetical protein